MCTDDWGRLQIVLQNAKKTVDKIFNHTQGNGNSVNTLWKTFFASDKIAKDMSYPALILLQATKQLTELGMTLTEIREAYSPKTVEEVSKKSLCQSTPIEECAAGGFRTFSGYCNNVAHPMWGTVFQAFSRIAPASYLDGISIPRKAADGFDLPSSLLVSETVFTDSAGGKHPAASLLLAQWAQFVYDDLVKIGTLTDKNGALVNCCNIEQSSECFPVRSTVPAKSTCIPYSRTLPALNASCTLGERQQANQATAFLDASMIYGNTGKTAAILRSYKNGELKVLRAAKGHFLLPQEENIQNCASAASQLCFLSGTSNVNLMPTQTALHTVWVLQHNRVAKRLKEINEFWDDERIYRETRKIIGAQIQHITFNEFLPVVLGSNAMQNEKITLEPNGYSGDYDMEENPSVLNEYATAAGLFFYSLFPESMLLPKSGRSVKFAGSFYDSQILYTHNGLEDIIRFMLNENSKHFGTSVGSQFTDGFLSTSGIPGFDLMAVFIQMGRDHGLPSYVEIRKHCGLKPVKSFGDLETAVQNKEVIQKLKLLYKRVDDIDLLPMGLAEKPLPGSFVGPTFACIIAKQFAKVQRGDRYWYESFFYPSQFTSTQLSEIRKTSLATVLCDNVPDMTYIQPAAFMTPDNYENAVISCKSELMKPMNISAWRDVEPPIELPITERTIENAIRIAEQRVRDVQLKERHLQLSSTLCSIAATELYRGYVFWK
uniref:Uncharacterized protein n=1 Tax=Trichuris muris TaxID=70415 RepID=A0A5S6QII5_TRIMR